MKYAITALLALTFLLPVPPIQADTYTWTDDQGTTHFTDDQGNVPSKFRHQVIKSEDTASPPAPETVPTGKTRKPTSAQKEEVGNAPSGNKNFTDLQKGLTDRETAIEAVRSKIVEIVSKLNSADLTAEEAQQLLTDHKTLTEQFNSMRAEYDAYVEQLRKAGVQVNLQK